MRTVTIEEILSYRPCGGTYTRERLDALFAGREALTPQDILGLAIPWRDKWRFLIFVMPQRWLVARSCDFAEHVLPVWEAEYSYDARPRQTLETARAWLRGAATRAQVDYASAAAYHAGEKAARDAAKAAKRAAQAAEFAAQAAAVSFVAYAAHASYAAYAARADDARAAELAWQEARVRETLSDAEED